MLYTVCDPDTPAVWLGDVGQYSNVFHISEDTVQKSEVSIADMHQQWLMLMESHQVALLGALHVDLARIISEQWPLSTQWLETYQMQHVLV